MSSQINVQITFSSDDLHKWIMIRPIGEDIAHADNGNIEMEFINIFRPFKLGNNKQTKLLFPKSACTSSIAIVDKPDSNFKVVMGSKQSVLTEMTRFFRINGEPNLLNICLHPTFDLQRGITQEDISNIESINKDIEWFIEAELNTNLFLNTHTEDCYLFLNSEAGEVPNIHFGDNHLALLRSCHLSEKIFLEDYKFDESVTPLITEQTEFDTDDNPTNTVKKVSDIKNDRLDLNYESKRRGSVFDDLFSCFDLGVQDLSRTSLNPKHSKRILNTKYDYSKQDIIDKQITKPMLQGEIPNECVEMLRIMVSKTQIFQSNLSQLIEKVYMPNNRVSKGIFLI